MKNKAPIYIDLCDQSSKEHVNALFVSNSEVKTFYKSLPYRLSDPEKEQYDANLSHNVVKLPDNNGKSIYSIINYGYLGKGQFCKIYKELGYWQVDRTGKYCFYQRKNGNDRPLVLKELYNFEYPIADFRREYQISSMFEYLGVKYSMVGNCFLMNYFPQRLGDLINELRINPKQVPTELRFELSIGLLEALLFQHKKKVIHRDLKVDNIMLNRRRNKGFIIDFGFSKTEDELKNSEPEYKGNLLYGDPQYILRITGANRITDLFSMILIIIQIWGDRARHDIEISRCRYRLKHENYNIQFRNLFHGLDDLSDNIKKKLESIFTKMTRFDHKKRLSHKKVLKEIKQLYQQYKNEKEMRLLQINDPRFFSSIGKMKVSESYLNDEDMAAWYHQNSIKQCAQPGIISMKSTGSSGEFPNKLFNLNKDNIADRSRSDKLTIQNSHKDFEPLEVEPDGYCGCILI